MDFATVSLIMCCCSMSDFSFNHYPVLLILYIRQASILLILQFGACFILVSSSPNTLSTDMLFGGHDSDFLAKVSEGLQNLPF